MRLDICYRMAFSYDLPVWEAQNEIRVRPCDSERQRTIAYRLTPSPAARVLSFVDYWGTTVDHVGLRRPHVGFDLVAEAAVETSESVAPESDREVEDLAAPEFARSMTEYLLPSSHVEWTPALAAMATEVIGGTDSVLARTDACVALVHDTLGYERGSTEIGVSLSDLVRGGRGVCQDFAHLTIGFLRSVGVPARYVSGYLFAADETRLDDESADPVQVQTHAWVEVALPGHGWYPVDPTNRRPVGNRHVVIGHGRDYDDVAPVRGVFVGPGTPTVDAEVEIRRMEPTLRATGFERARPLSSFQLESFRQQQQQQQQQ